MPKQRYWGSAARFAEVLRRMGTGHKAKEDGDGEEAFEYRPRS
jgi:hypothetical protein